MDTIQHNPARFYNCDETGITIVQHQHTKILGLKGKRQMFSLHSVERGSLVSVVSPTGPFLLPLLVKKYETRTAECHTAWINPRLPSLGVDTERDFFIKQANKRRWCYLSNGQALFTHTTNLEVITLAKGNHVDIICISHLTAATKCDPWIKLSWGS
jgi:hypothetical protein